MVAVAACVLLASCGGKGAPPYEAYDESGFNVSVKYDANGAPTVIDEGFSKRQRHEELMKKLNSIKQEIKDGDYYRSDSEEAFMELEDEESILLYNRNKNFKNRR